MTGEQLREELVRIAEGAPEVHVPDDLFARGRRATVRARVVVGAASIACVAAVVALVAPVVGSDETKVADGDAPIGVPDVIYEPPLGERSIDFPVTPLDDIGPAAAAYQVEDEEGHVVVISPNGVYQAVLLPDRWEPMLDEATPALSPDGLQLAYASQRELVRRLSILDLTTGDIRDVALGSSKHGAVVSTLQWSPDGQWIVWSGQEVEVARESGMSYRPGTIAGLIGPDATRSRVLPELEGNAWRRPGICDDGTPLRFVQPTFLAYDGTSGGSVPERFRSWVELRSAHGECSAPDSYFRHSGPGYYRLLGWLPSKPGDPGPVAVVQIEHSRLVLAWPLRARERVGRIEAAWTSNLSVATGLMSADQPTVPAGESPWDRPWIVEHWLALLGFLAVGAVSVLIVVQARAVRR